jgi:copper(I)-binding protein
MRSDHIPAGAHVTVSTLTTRFTIAMAIAMAPFLFAISLPLAHAQEFSVGPVTISDAWSPPLPPVSENGVAYLKLSNHEMKADRLVTASTPVANRVEFHTSVKSGKMMMMEKMPAVELPAHGNVALSPGGMHLMLIQLKAPLQKDTHFPLTLTFEHAGTVTVDVLVRSPAGAKGTPAMEHHKPGMHSK